jgi:hypothetical protein
MSNMPDLLHPRTGLKFPRTAAATLCMAGAIGASSCQKATRTFMPPPSPVRMPQPAAPEPQIELPAEVAFEPAVFDFPRQSDPSVRFPELPAPRPARTPVANAPKPVPAPPENPPALAPKLAQILTPEEQRRNNVELDQSMDRVRRALTTLGSRNLSPELKDVAERVRTYLVQAEQTREQDLVTAVNLARRADLLAKDLLERLP